MAAIATLTSVLVACGASFSDAEPTSAIFRAAPWESEETLFYNVWQRTYLRGACTLTTSVDRSSGTTELTQFCIDREEGLYEDNRTVVVDSETFQPIRSAQIIANNKDERVETKSVVYPVEGLIAQFLSVSGENEFGATRELPEPSLDVPSPVWYDDGALMWLVRGIDFSETGAIRFTDVSASTVTVFNAEFRVEGRERIQVTAGTFETWKIRLSTKTVTQRFWVDVDAPHRVVQAKIENVTFELVGVE